MKNNFTLVAFLALVLVFAAGVSPVSAGTTNGSDDAVPPVVTAPSGATSGSTTNGSDDTVTPPAQNEQPAGNTNSASTNGADDAPTPQAPIVPPVTPPGGGNGSGGSSGSIGSSGSAPTNVPVVTLVTSGLAPSSCPLITDYLKFGGANNQVQVTKLQSFLKNAEKLNIDVNGNFDQKTQDAVIAFQKKYSQSILGPWDASQASGFVFITTVKKINEIACASQFVLTADELATIEAFKKDRDNPSGQSVETGQIGQLSTSTAGTLEVGTTDAQGNANVAAVGGTSMLSRFWNFIKELFQ